MVTTCWLGVGPDDGGATGDWEATADGATAAAETTADGGVTGDGEATAGPQALPATMTAAAAKVILSVLFTG